MSQSSKRLQVRMFFRIDRDKLRRLALYYNSCRGGAYRDPIFPEHVTFQSCMTSRNSFQAGGILINGILKVEFFAFFSEIDYCHENPCQNNGTCINDFEDYICYCPANFTGQNCEGAQFFTLSIKQNYFRVFRRSTIFD